MLARSFNRLCELFLDIVQSKVQISFVPRQKNLPLPPVAPKTEERLTIRFPTAALEQVRLIQALTGAPSEAAVVSDALRTWLSIAQHQARGVVFWASEPNGAQSVVDFITYDTVVPAKPQFGSHLTLVIDNTTDKDV